MFSRATLRLRSRHKPCWGPSHLLQLFHQVFPDYFVTSALFPSPGPPICWLQTMKVPVCSSLPLWCGHPHNSTSSVLHCLATLPLASFVSLAATISAPSQPPCAPAAINLQVLSQPMIVDAVQRAFHDLALASFASANAPSSLSAAYIQPSSSSSQAPSSLGESLHFLHLFPPFVLLLGCLHPPLCLP